MIPVVTPKEMLSVSMENGKTKVRINSSSLSIIQECKRKAQYSLVEKWKAGVESPATLFGSAVHKALEVFYSGEIAERRLPELETLELMAFGNHANGEESDLILRSFRAFVEKAKPLESLPAENKRSIQNGAYTLWHYFKSYLDDPYISHADDSGPMIERAVSFRLYEDDNLIIEYFGTIDLVVRNHLTGEILVCDHKTSSVVGSDFYNRLKPNHQYTGYLLAAQFALGIQTNSFLINCLQVKERPKTSQGTPPHFPRQITTRDENDYEEFRETVRASVCDFLLSQRDGVWPLGHVNVCAMYGGCQYLSVCSAPTTMRKTILEAKFTRGDGKCV